MRKTESKLALVAMLAAATAGDAWALGWSGMTLDNSPCEGGGQAFGPFDYFDVNDPDDQFYDEGRLWEADDRHFNQGVFFMRQEPLGLADYQRAAGEFDYMLRAYPNHPGALASLIELEVKRQRVNRNRAVPLRAGYPPPECYFLRAISYRPQQFHIRLIFGTYLHRAGHYDAALEQYSVAMDIRPDSAEVYYNAGLAHFELGQYEQARTLAQQAYSAGYPLPGLRNKLRRANQWQAQATTEPR